MRNKILILSLLLLLSSCSQFQDPADKDYYTGFEGVNTEFAQGSPPSELFVNNEGPTQFTVDVRVANEGASIAKGGVYLSGYDPTIIDFEEIDEDRGRFDDCHYNIQRITFSNFEGFVQCRRINMGSIGDADVGINIDNGVQISIGDLGLGDILDELFGSNIFTNMGFNRTDISFDSRDGGALYVDFENPNFDPRDGARGKYFLSLWAPIKFDMNEGREFLLRGDIPTNPGEKEEFITYNGKVEQLPTGRDRTSQPIMITSCYLYTTHVAEQVCVDQRPYDDVEKACRSTTYASKRGQGAPIAVTSIQPRNAGNQMAFRIQIENIGDGTVFNPLNMQRCSPYNPLPLTEEDTDIVVVGMVNLGDERLDCYPEKNTLRLYNGRGVINCVHDFEDGQPSRTGYETSLTVELWYGYSETIRRTIDIQRI